MKQRLRDVIFVLPGTTGSVLSRGGTPVWDASHRLLGKSLVQRRRAVQDLALDGGPLTAEALMPQASLVAGLFKVDGYSRLTQALASHFDVRHAVAAGTRALPPSNLIEFPYDWRLDNRVTAARLATVAERALADWRAHANVPDAQLIFVAHSMGGLIARYFLDVLGGHRLTRALVSIGTPFGGSLDALGYLANGYRKGHLDLTDVMRTFPSVHQLLPVEAVVHDATATAATGNRTPLRIAEAGPVTGVDPKLAADAELFHEEIAEGAKALADAGSRYAVLPVVGTHQLTWQSAVYDGSGVSLGRDLPAGVHRYFGSGDRDGDGTVGISSAAPADPLNVYADVFQAEKHASLHNNPHVLHTLLGRLTRMQARLQPQLRGPEPVVVSGQLALGVDVEDHYAGDEPVVVQAEVFAPGRPEKVTAVAEHTGSGELRAVDLVPAADGEGAGGRWRAELHGLAAGVYRLEVGAGGTTVLPPPVHDLFEVGGTGA
ncbi:esterase/lipase family protein [Streptomyces sp. NPDC091027]|uniref:esterase/lipase family protein n=1 Tax=Streptomyces sp. NPDC091027 TaxID=3365971 RepID=UPI00382B4301